MSKKKIVLTPLERQLLKALEAAYRHIGFTDTGVHVELQGKIEDAIIAAGGKI